VEIAHAAVSRRLPISLYTMVPRTEGYAYDVGVWDLSIVQGPFSVARCQPLRSRIRHVCIRVPVRCLGALSRDRLIPLSPTTTQGDVTDIVTLEAAMTGLCKATTRPMAAHLP
jgi:hypothetical protein